jgi:hypothetical protein
VLEINYSQTTEIHNRTVLLDEWVETKKGSAAEFEAMWNGLTAQQKRVSILPFIHFFLSILSCFDTSPVVDRREGMSSPVRFRSNYLHACLTEKGWQHQEEDQIGPREASEPKSLYYYRRIM